MSHSSGFFISLFRGVAKVLAVFAGLFLLLTGAGLATSFILLYSERDMLPWDAVHHLDYNLLLFWIESMGHSSGLFNLALIALLAIPVMFLIYAGMRLIFGIQVRISGAFTTMLVAWIAGFVILGIIIGRITYENQYESEITMEEETILSDSAAYFQIKAGNEISLPERTKKNIVYTIFDDEIHLPLAMKDSLLYGHTELSVFPSPDSLIHIRSFISSQGKNRTDAADNINRVNFQGKYEGSSYILSPFFTVSSDPGWRNHMFRLEIQIPQSKGILIDKELQENIVKPSIFRKDDHDLIFRNENGRIIIN